MSNRFLTAPVRRWLVGAFAALVLSPVFVSTASAQETTSNTPAGPTQRDLDSDDRQSYPGLYGRQPSTEAARQYLEMDVRVFQGYLHNGTDGALTAPETNPFATRSSLAYPGVSAGLQYLRTRRTVAIDAFSQTMLNYFTQVGGETTIAETASGMLAWTMSRSLSLTVNGAVTYRPESTLGAAVPLDSRLDSGVSLSEASLAVNNVAGLMTVSTAVLTKTLGQQMSVSGHYTYHDSRSPDRLFDLQAQEYGGVFRRQLTRYASFHAGYANRFSSTVRQFHVHNIDVGLDYSRPLSFTRRTTVGFTTGSAVLQPTGDGAIRVVTQFRFLGSAFAKREFGRSWSTRVGYQRNFNYLEGFETPVFTSSIIGTVNGFLTRRLNLRVAVRHSAVDRSFDAGRAFGTTSALASTRYALREHFALFAEYSLFGYDLPPAGVSPQMSLSSPTVLRNGVRAGVTFWVPLAGR